MSEQNPYEAPVEAVSDAAARSRRRSVVGDTASFIAFSLVFFGTYIGLPLLLDTARSGYRPYRVMANQNRLAGAVVGFILGGSALVLIRRVVIPRMVNSGRKHQ